MEEALRNPFTPIFGKVPACMAGREHLADDMRAAFRSEGNDPNLVSLHHTFTAPGATFAPGSVSRF